MVFEPISQLVVYTFAMARTATDNLQLQRASSANAYVALFALAVLQLGLALHHEHHDATELTSQCVACIQLEQFDDLVPVSGTEFVTASQDPGGSIAHATAPTQRFLRSYNSRAPPSHS